MNAHSLLLFIQQGSSRRSALRPLILCPWEGGVDEDRRITCTNTHTHALGSLSLSLSLAPFDPLPQCIVTPGAACGRWMLSARLLLVSSDSQS